MDRNKRIFKKLVTLGIVDVEESRKIENEPYMALNIDRLSKNVFAIAHNYIQNGDVMADPDMTVEIDLENQVAEALTFQISFPPLYQEVYALDDDGRKKGVRLKLKKQLNAFLESWLDNMINQGFAAKAKVAA